MSEASAIVDGVLVDHALAGLSLGVVTRDGLVDTVVRGVAASDRPIELDTVFRIGSVTKTMTAIALLRQWEAGNFELDDPVNDHLRGLELVGRRGWRPPTVRHLLTHTAGIGELAAWSDLRRPLFGLATPVDVPAPDVLARYGGKLRLDVEPGTKWAYANHGFNVLGLLVETLSGEPYADHVRSVLFEPLGMEHTDAVRSDRVRARLANGYVNRRGGLRPSRQLDLGLPAAGAVFSTLPDLATYAAALLDHGQGIVKADTLRDAFEPQYRPCATHPGIGLSFFRDEIAGKTIIGHGGGLPGFVTAFALAPADGVGVVAFTNGGGEAVALAAHRVLCALLGVPDRPQPRPLRPDRWAELIGYYRPAPGPLTNARFLVAGGGVEVAVRRRQLVMRAPSPIGALRRGTPMQPVDEAGRVYAVDLEELGLPPFMVHVDRGDDGVVSLHLAGSAIGAMPGVRKTSNWKNPRRLLGAAGIGAATTLAVRRVTR